MGQPSDPPRASQGLGAGGGDNGRGFGISELGERGSEGEEEKTRRTDPEVVIVGGCVEDIQGKSRERLVLGRALLCPSSSSN
eukprot:763564-Hanusia_phi.AAC.4